MKKLLALLLCLLMCFSLMFGMTACGDDKDDKDDKSSSSVKDDKDDKDDEDDEDEDNDKDEEDDSKSDEELIVGKWEATLNPEDMGAENHYDPNADLEEIAENPMLLFDLSKIKMIMCAEFKSNGKVTMSFENLDELKSDMEQMIEGSISNIAENIVDETIKEYGEEVLEGMTKKEAVDEIKKEIKKELGDDIGFFDEEEFEEMSEGTTSYYKFIDGKLYFSDDGDFDDFTEEDAIDFEVSKKKLELNIEDEMKITFTRK